MARTGKGRDSHWRRRISRLGPFTQPANQGQSRQGSCACNFRPPCTIIFIISRATQKIFDEASAALFVLFVLVVFVFF